MLKIALLLLSLQAGAAPSMLAPELNTFRGNYWDKYEGYDLNRDGTGDVPYHPVSVYSILSERIPATMILYRSFLTNIMDQAEKVMPSIIPDQLRDDAPKTKKWKL